jgi:histidinol-phosphate aminotransferase
MNEGVPGLPEAFVREILAEINPSYLASYPEYSRLQGAIAGHNQLLPQNILLANGSDAAIKYIFDAFVSPGDQVLLANPSFAMYPVYCQMFAARPIMVEYREDFTLPLEDFLTRISQGVRLAVVVNPNNPTGEALSRDELLAIIGAAASHNVLLMVDEAYYYFYPETVIHRVPDFQNLIVLRTFSKLCAVAAVRLGYAAACPEIIENLNKVRPTFDVNGLAALLGEKILSNPQVIPTLVREVNAGKNYLIGKLAESGIEHRPGQANFVLIRCPGKSGDLARRLAQEKILVASGFKDDFLKDYLRVTVGRREVMERFWQVFHRIWEEERVEEVRQKSSQNCRG